MSVFLLLSPFGYASSLDTNRGRCRRRFGYSVTPSASKAMRAIDRGVTPSSSSGLALTPKNKVADVGILAPTSEVGRIELGKVAVAKDESRVFLGTVQIIDEVFDGFMDDEGGCTLVVVDRI